MGHVVLDNVTVGGPNAADQNDADGGYGGGSVTRADSVSVSNSSFRGNVAQNSEVGGLRVGNSVGLVSITNSSFVTNRAAQNCGGLSVTSNTSDVVLRGLNVDGNLAGTYSAGAHIVGNASLMISASVFDNNIAGQASAGMSVDRHLGRVVIEDTSISGNRVTNGSTGGLGLGNNTGVVQIRRVVLNGNEARRGTSRYVGSAGAAIYNNTSVTMTDSTASGNTSDFHVSALSLGASFSPFDPATGLPVTTLPPTTNTITFDRATISGNVTSGAAAGGAGFAVMCIDSPGLYTFLNSTITGNTVTGGCGGAFSAGAFNPSTQTNATRVVFRNSTLARNTATQCHDVGGGLWRVQPGRAFALTGD